MRSQQSVIVYVDHNCCYKQSLLASHLLILRCGCTYSESCTWYLLLLYKSLYSGALTHFTITPRSTLRKTFRMQFNVPWPVDIFLLFNPWNNSYHRVLNSLLFSGECVSILLFIYNYKRYQNVLRATVELDKRKFMCLLMNCCCWWSFAFSVVSSSVIPGRWRSGWPKMSWTYAG